MRGGPGSGKTTLGLHYLAAGAANGEKTLFICLGEPEDHIRRNAEALGFQLQDIIFLDLSPGPEYFAETEAYEIFSLGEIERKPTTQKIVKHIEELEPVRVFIDSMTQLRYLAPEPSQFRKQVLSFLRFLTDHGVTVLFTSESSPNAPDDDLLFLSDGVINLESTSHDRTLRVSKFRGSGLHAGIHFVRLSDRGMQVFPRLIPEAYRREFIPEAMSSGIPDLDGMLHGGLERGTITILSGPSGVGKTTLGILFVKEAAERGERSVLYAFEEGLHTLLHRSEAVNIPIRSMIDRGNLSLVKVEPLRHSPEDFARMVRREVEEHQARIVMIDSVSGYRISLGGDDLVVHLHALCKYLANMGVTTILVNEVESITGQFQVTEVGISYMADNIIFMRYLEFNGELRKAIGVLKKRVSSFEKTMREMKITQDGIRVGQPLTGLRGILSGIPELLDTEGAEG